MSVKFLKVLDTIEQIPGHHSSKLTTLKISGILIYSYTVKPLNGGHSKLLQFCPLFRDGL